MATAVRSIETKCKVCPACIRKLPVAKVADKKLAQDIARATASIAILDDVMRTNRYGLGEAAHLEAKRLRRALADHRLLWSIYRRRDKATGYGIPKPRLAEAA